MPPDPLLKSFLTGAGPVFKDMNTKFRALSTKFTLHKPFEKEIIDSTKEINEATEQVRCMRGVLLLVAHCS